MHFPSKLSKHKSCFLYCLRAKPGTTLPSNCHWQEAIINHTQIEKIMVSFSCTFLLVKIKILSEVSTHCSGLNNCFFLEHLQWQHLDCQLGLKCVGHHSRECCTAMAASREPEPDASSCHYGNDFSCEPRGIHQIFSIGIACPLSYLSLVLEVQCVFTNLARTCPLLQHSVTKGSIVPLGTTRNTLLLFSSLPCDQRAFPEANLPPNTAKQSVLNIQRGNDL